jgi:hypothetical protein
MIHKNLTKINLNWRRNNANTRMTRRGYMRTKIRRPLTLRFFFLPQLSNLVETPRYRELTTNTPKMESLAVIKTC